MSKWIKFPEGKSRLKVMNGCISQGRLSYAVVTSNSKTSVTSINKSFSLTCMSILSQKDCCDLYSHSRIQVLEQAASQLLLVTTSTGN